MPPKRKDWSAIQHEDRVRLLQTNSIEQISGAYQFPGYDDEAFRRYLAAQRTLWDVGNIGAFEESGHPPTKDIVLGAWRDLDRSEALLELIDNSIDAWLDRRQKHPRQTPPELNSYIDIDATNRHLIYEDNAGGVPLLKLNNLVVPGFSNTESLSQTIGSYKTGGKKAIFRLAVEARITTRYWNPAGSGDEAFSIHLDDHWMTDTAEYTFPYAPLKDVTVLEKGQTRYVLQMRTDPGGTQWFESPDEIAKLVKSIRQTYTLLMVKMPALHIHFNDRKTPLAADDQLYQFSDMKTKGIDIRPQQVTFTVELEFEGAPHSVDVEVVLGCRTTTGIQDGRSWGIDLYGNDRLFVPYDQDTFAQWMPAGNARQLVRGYVNIKGPNVFVPWDTHKRHLNADRDIMKILTRHKQVRELFENWKKAYNDIGKSGKGEVTKIIRHPIATPFDSHAKRLTVGNVNVVDIKAKATRGAALPKKVFVPRVKVPTGKKNDSVKVTLTLSSTEASLVAAYYGVQGEVRGADLCQPIKDDLMKRVARRQRS